MTDDEKAKQIVYISCLEEVRCSFVSHLSEALRRKGINDLFVDSNDLLSKEAEAVVERARVSVMVLPRSHYPTTTACLVKLGKVLDCQRNDDQVVVPVLYGNGVTSVEDEWRRALQDLSCLSPSHHSRKECSDSGLVKEIVRDGYEKLFNAGRIGIYSKLLDIENMVNKQPLGIRSVGIWGMPGIGKTTLAKAVFDQMSGEFDACCFIEDYDRVIHEKGLYRVLEEQFLKEKPAAGCTISKLSLLRDKLNSKRVLAVLDDVRNPLVAESFLGGFDWFGPGSLIIITSRDKQVFRLCRVNQVYEVQGLNEKESLQLFSVCASIKDMSEKNLRKLSMKVIRYAYGNPLALTIYGKKKLSEVQNLFLKLKGRPPSAIFDVVKSSYDTLSDSEKNIFLDIACFFRGDKVDYVMPLLEGCDFFPHVGVDVLVDKCLVTISENHLQMHNLIQDVGREIINGETIHVERRRRLWETWSIKYLLEDHKTTLKSAQGTEDIEGIFLDTLNLGFDVKPAAFENMLNLRLLKIYSSNSEIHPVFSFSKGFLQSLPRELRLLHWENYPLQFLPQNFDPMHLVEINMPYSQLHKLWGVTKNMEMLRTIRLCHSQELVDIDDILKAQNLEVIDLQGCTRLQSFPATGQLLHLRAVNLSGCTEIKIFPEVPPNIETLHLQGTGIRGLPLSIVKPNGGELESLLAEFQGLSDALKLQRVTSLVKSSSYCQDLGKLIFLDLKDCSRLQSLPDMSNLEFLKVLDLSSCSKIETIQGFPPNLKELYIAGTAFPMHYTFSNCFDLSPQMVNDFLVKALANVKHILMKEHPKKLNKALAFSFCVPSHVNQNSNLDLQLGSSVMTRLNPSWKSTLVGFTMLVEVAFSEDYHDATGFGICCVCRWKNKEGHPQRIQRNFHCWAAGKDTPKVQKDHMFVFSDVKMHPSTSEGNNPNILVDLVVFEFFPISKQMKLLDDTCTVTRCGVRVITTPTGNTSLEHISAGLSLDPVQFSGDEVEEVLRVSYDPTGNANPKNISSLFSSDTVEFPGNEVLRVSYDPTGNTSLEDFSLPLSSDPMEFSDDEVFRVRYDPTGNASLEIISSLYPSDPMEFSDGEAEKVLRVSYDPAGNTSLEDFSLPLSSDPMEFSDDEVLGVSYDPTGNANLENISSLYPSDPLEFSGNDVLRFNYDPTGNASIGIISPVLSSDPMAFSDNEVEKVFRVSYDGLHQRDKALFLYIACLFNDEDVDLVAPHIASIDVNISFGLKVLADKSLICLSSNGEIVLHCLLRQMGKEILHRLSMLHYSSEYLTRGFKEVSMASSSSHNWKYDVFPSFSGQDVLRNFLSHLIVVLEFRLITTFKDVEIERDQPTNLHLSQVMRESRILIIVFSENYASSSWILNVLVEIAESKEELGQMVIPIFYYVDPSDVMKQTGEFGRLLEQTCMNKTEDEKQRWCQALINIARIPGYHYRGWNDDAVMVEKIVSDVTPILYEYKRKKRAQEEAVSILDTLASIRDLLGGLQLG
ncbi:unnamed protein product [Microthlaspi erraticum]|uniref:TIR domain-containing protein n=1 Tax=Microthlaspi erraticum TaxID=1685480 RepID=A0A6D2KVP7_9BRAS|nr:unnamed protein product [Microthlaspi erraticum]